MLRLDTSAAVKLLDRKEYTDALAAYLAEKPTERLVSCGLIRTELPRALRGPSPEVESLLGSLGIVELTGSVLSAAGRLVPATSPRSLDAIRLSAAGTLGRSLFAVLTYDRRMADAAATLAMPVAIPV